MQGRDELGFGLQSKIRPKLQKFQRLIFSFAWKCRSAFVCMESPSPAPACSHNKRAAELKMQAGKLGEYIGESKNPKQTPFRMLPQ